MDRATFKRQFETLLEPATITGLTGTTARKLTADERQIMLDVAYSEGLGREEWVAQNAELIINQARMMGMVTEDGTAIEGS